MGPCRLLLLMVVLVTAPLSAQVAVGREAPNFVFSKSWNLMAGYNDLESLNGRPVLVEHWATWCPPCVENVPHLNQLHDAYSSQGLTIVAVSSERPSTIEGFVQKHGMRYPVVQSANAGNLYGVSSIPHAFLLNPKGKVVWEGHPGELTGPDLERMVGLRPPLTTGSTMESAVPVPQEGGAGIWILVIGALALMTVGALGWFWWKTSDRPAKASTMVYAPAYAGAPQPQQPPGAPPQGAPPSEPAGPAAVLAPSQRPASSTAVAPLLTQPGSGPSSGMTRSIKLTPSGRFPTVPYAAGGPPQPQGYPQAQPLPQEIEPEILTPDQLPAPAPPGRPIQFRPFNAGGKQ